MYWPHIWMHILSLTLCLVAGVQLWRQYISRMKMSLVYNKHVKTFAKPREWISRPYDVGHISLNKCLNNKTCYRISGRISWRNFITNSILLLFYLFIYLFIYFWPQGMWNLSFPTRDQTCTLCITKWSLSHWTPTKIPIHWLFFIHIMTGCPVIILLYPYFPDYPK